MPVSSIAALQRYLTRALECIKSTTKDYKVEYRKQRQPSMRVECSSTSTQITKGKYGNKIGIYTKSTRLKPLRLLLRFA